MQQSLRATPYTRYVIDAEGVERARLFIRLEHLDEDLAPLEDHLGFRLGPIPHVNRSDHSENWRAQYGDSEVRIVAELCETDINRFGYAFS